MATSIRMACFDSVYLCPWIFCENFTLISLGIVVIVVKLIVLALEELVVASIAIARVLKAVAKHCLLVSLTFLSSSLESFILIQLAVSMTHNSSSSSSKCSSDSSINNSGHILQFHFDTVSRSKIIADTLESIRYRSSTFFNNIYYMWTIDELPHLQPLSWGQWGGWHPQRHN